MDDNREPVIARAGDVMLMGYEGQVTPRQKYLILKDFDIDLIFLQATGKNPRDTSVENRSANAMLTMQYLLDHHYLELQNPEARVLN